MEALILMPAIARWTMVYAIFRLSLRQRAGAGDCFSSGKHPALAGDSHSHHAGCIDSFMGVDGLAVTAAALLAAILMGSYLNRKLGWTYRRHLRGNQRGGRGGSPDSNSSDNLELRRMSMTLILGGARSGKSRFAQELAAKLGKKVLFVATGEAAR